MPSPGAQHHGQFLKPLPQNEKLWSWITIFQGALSLSLSLSHTHTHTHTRTHTHTHTFAVVGLKDFHVSRKSFCSKKAQKTFGGCQSQMLQENFGVIWIFYKMKIQIIGKDFEQLDFVVNDIKKCMLQWSHSCWGCHFLTAMKQTESFVTEAEKKSRKQ